MLSSDRAGRGTAGRAAALIACAVLAAGAAGAQGTTEVGVQLTVLHASPKPGPPPDANVAPFDKQLRGQFRYQSLRIMERSQLRMSLLEMRKVRLPLGNELRVQPIQRDPEGLLTELAMPGRLDTRVLLQRSRPVMIRAGAYEGGSLIIAIEPVD